MPQPNFVPVMFRVSRKTQSSGISGLTSTDWALPFKVKLMAMESSLLQGNILQQLAVKMKIGGNSIKPSANQRREPAATAGSLQETTACGICGQLDSPKDSDARHDEA